MPTMKEKCFVCGKEQEIGESFIRYEFEDGGISFCYNKCSKYSCGENYIVEVLNN